MTRTINRQPWTVRNIDYGDTGYKYFGYNDWKGKCTNKNFIGIDQETFEDCENIYVDRDSVLRSRPAMKLLQSPVNNIVNVWTFGPWTVYKYVVGSNEKLYFVKGDYNYTSENVPTNCKLVLADEKIFVFGNNYAKYFDTVTKAYKDATDLIYSPVTKLYTYGNETELEQPNLWSKTHRERYIWNKKTPIDLTKLVGKNVTAQIADEDEINIESFQKYQEYTVPKELYNNLDASYLYLPIKSVSDTGVITRVGTDEGIFMMDVSKYNSVVRATKTTKDGHTYYNVEYSVDGIVFNKLSELPWSSTKQYDCYYKPRFSDDGTIVYLYTSAGVYAISVLAETTDGTYRYADWTNICEKFQVGNLTYLEYGAAHMYTYNTFSVFTGVANDENASHSLVMVREGTVTVKPPFLPHSNFPNSFSDRYYSIVCNTKSTLLCTIAKYDTSQPFPQYCLYGFSTDSDTPIIQRVSVFDSSIISHYSYSVLTAASLYNVVNLSAILYVQRGKLTLVKYSLSNVTNKLNLDIVDSIFVDEVNYPVVAENDSSILTKDKYVYNRLGVDLLQNNIIPVTVKNNYLYYAIYDSTTQKYTIYTTYTTENIEFTETVTDKQSIDYYFDCEAELSQYYISKGKKVYITSKGAYTDNDFDWYFSEEYAKDFDYEVTGLHPISTSEVAVFTQDNIYYIVPTTVTIDNQEHVAYQYYKSRIPLGCNKGSDIVTSYDGKYTIFSTKRGLVAMAYQDFVSSTEQALTFLSDNIDKVYFDWNQGAVKLTLYKYWLIVYRLDTEYSFVYDMRNSSWWPMQYAIVQQVIEIAQKLTVLARYTLYTTYTGDDNYKDDYYGNIKWSLLSQKLHFNAINYYKAINNITLSSVMTSLPDPGNPFTCNMRVTTYRKIMDGTQLPETMSFYVDMIRTFVKKLNYIKLGQFQYELSSDNDNVQQKPLSLTSIVIKYKTTGQVR